MITAACLQCFFMHDVTDIFVFTKNLARKFSKSPSSMIMQYIDASCLNNKIIMMMFQFIVNFPDTCQLELLRHLRRPHGVSSTRLQTSYVVISLNVENQKLKRAGLGCGQGMT